ncbi:MAG TPA: acyl-CoA dehydratase activase [Spirochaetota bacterium]|nr:acyl-CoA dehydratase activase [Spirochaetota bacterium]
MRSLGICLGASTITFVEIKNENNNINIENVISKAHEGSAKDVFLSILKSVNPENFDRIVVTGRKFRENVNLTSITEPEAIEYSLEYLNLDNREYNILVSAGGETTIVYELDDEHHITKVHIGNKCASGTGEFFLQQIRRMDLKPDEAIRLAENAHPHKIAGRCSVFCKSDCTHALNIGEPKGSVVAGLCRMMSGKITELIATINPKNVILTGGVSKNKIVVKYLRDQVDKLLIPEQASYFEALGAALYGLKNETKKFESFDTVYKEGKSSFEFLKKLSLFTDKVSFKTNDHEKPEDGMVTILGIDVGSTTTKAVLLNKATDKIIASVYLRTNGNPVEAARNCYRSLKEQIKGKDIKIIGLGVTGSGRQIVGLHAFTESVINEIVCHATASVFFDKDVDTIFEIGGQDAKYTYIVNGVPADYAMNEACSAGTGSFLEESAMETLGVKTEEIGDIALKAQNPPNFNDQCAAFISSDIKVASQEGISRDDMIAGLVYSICMNYTNRVKGNRRVGNKVFMQGGVCYNKAVPVAMAALTGKDIIVPPDPGLMGAFGVALEVKKRIDNNLCEPKEFNLDTLINREVSYGEPFKCGGGKEKCDIGCEILTVIIDGKKYAFGGACNKYYNIIHNLKYDEDKLDMVAMREKLIFGKYAPEYRITRDKIIGINRSFYTNSYYPLYYNFFSKLGFKVVISEKATINGMETSQSSFCYPMQLAHGFFDDLLSKRPDYIFMPHLVQLETDGCASCKKPVGNKKSCVFNQGEPFALKSAFKDKLGNTEFLIPLLDFSRGIDREEKVFVRLAVNKLGVSSEEATKAFREALAIYREFQKEIKDIGKKVLLELEKAPDKIGVVLFGRPYNAFTEKANMGIPRKFTSRGIEIIPYDVLEYQDETFEPFMHWAMGESILKAAQIVQRHPQLFATYITNFSCGPDSFLVELFREQMKGKPSLTLELDSHSADAGVNTRIEAFLDVVRFYRELQRTGRLPKEKEDDYIQAWVEGDGFKAKIHLSDGKTVIPAKSDKYEFMFPSLSKYVMKPANEYLKRIGIDGVLVPETTMESIKLGRSQTSSKECLPQAIMMGNMMVYLRDRKDKTKPVVLLHATDTSPCRLEQYYNSFNAFVRRNRIKDFAIFRLDDRKGYSGFGTGLLLVLFKSFVIGDVIEDIRNAMSVIAEDKEYALKVLEEEFEKIVDNFGGREKIPLMKRLKLTAERLSKIPRKMNIEDAPFVTVTGEIYVRNDHFARRNIEGLLAEKGFIAKIIPFMETIFYADYALMNDLTEVNVSPFKKIYFFFKTFFQTKIDREIKNVFKDCGFYKPVYINLKEIIEASRLIVSPYIRGEVPITSGAALKYILNDSAGVISIGPFACLPSRMVESILKPNMNLIHKIALYGKKPLYQELEKMGVKNLPFLAIESDGNPFTQVTLAQIEVFCLQAKRMAEKMKLAKERLKNNIQAN